MTPSATIHPEVWSWLGDIGLDCGKDWARALTLMLADGEAEYMGPNVISRALDAGATLREAMEG